MPEWVPGAGLGILVALIAATGGLLSYQLARQVAIRRHENAQNRRIFRLINYARELQETAENAGISYAPWPDNLYDED